MSDVAVRPALPAELDEIAALTVAVYVDEGFIAEGSDYASHLAATREHAENGTVLVAVDEDDELLGAVTFCRHGSPLGQLTREREAEFRMLAVAPRARGRGVGEALVRTCLDLANEQGDRALVLSTKQEMTGAHRLYERLGFQRLPERDWTPVPGVQLLAYIRPLPR